MNHRISTALLALVTLLLVGAWYTPQPALAGNVINALPATISSSGTYYLGGNLVANAGDGGITVTAPDVVIDLGGFTLRGAGAADEEPGISGASPNIQVRNGTVMGWGHFGLFLGHHAKVTNVRVQNCATRGIQALSQAQIESCSFEANGEGDVNVTGSAVILDCHAKGNPDYSSLVVGSNSDVQRCHVQGGKAGIVASSHSRIRDCSAIYFEETGIAVGPGGSVADCNASKLQGEGLVGIKGSRNSKVRDCHVEGKIKVGIEVGELSTVRDSTVQGMSQVGIIAHSGTRVVDCTSSHNNQSQIPIGAGIQAYADVRIEGTLVAENMGRGILFLDDGGEVVDCTALGNSEHGIEVRSGAVVVDSLAKDNLLTGIQIYGDRGQFQRNTIDANDRGLVVLGHLNLVTDNRASQNRSEDFQVPWGNPTGPILETNWVIQGSTPQANFATR